MNTNTKEAVGNRNKVIKNLKHILEAYSKCLLRIKGACSQHMKGVDKEEHQGVILNHEELVALGVHEELIALLTRYAAMEDKRHVSHNDRYWAQGIFSFEYKVGRRPNWYAPGEAFPEKGRIMQVEFRPSLRYYPFSSVLAAMHDEAKALGMDWRKLLFKCEGTPIEAAATFADLIMDHELGVEKVATQIRMWKMRALKRVKRSRTAKVKRLPLHASAPEPTFRLNGSCWDIWYNGKGVQETDTIGFSYVAEALNAPFHSFFSIELYEAKHYAGRPAKDRAYMIGGARLDETAFTEYRNRLAEIDQNLCRAKSNNDPAWQKTLEEERDLLLEEMKNAVGIGGHRRAQDSDHERIRKNVSKAIHRCLKALHKSHPDLAKHLVAALKVGVEVCYHPETAVQWVTR